MKTMPSASDILAAVRVLAAACPSSFYVSLGHVKRPDFVALRDLLGVTRTNWHRPSGSDQRPIESFVLVLGDVEIHVQTDGLEERTVMEAVS